MASVGDVLKEFIIGISYSFNEESEKKVLTGLDRIEAETKRLSAVEQQAARQRTATVERESKKQTAIEEKERKKQADLAIAQAKQIQAALDQYVTSGLRKVAAAAASVTAAFAGFRVLNDSFQNFTALDNFSRHLGVAASDVKILGTALESMGGSKNDALGMIQGVASALLQNRGNLELLRSIGVTESKAGLNQMRQIADALSRLAKEYGEDVAFLYAQQLNLSESQYRLLRDKEAFEASIARTQQVFEQWGVKTKEQTEIVRAFGVVLGELKTQAQAVSDKILTAVLPAIKPFLDQLNEILLKNAGVIGGAIDRLGESLAKWAGPQADKFGKWLEDLLDPKNEVERQKWREWFEKLQTDAKAVADAVVTIGKAVSALPAFPEHLLRTMERAAKVLTFIFEHIPALRVARLGVDTGFKASEALGGPGKADAKKAVAETIGPPKEEPEPKGWWGRAWKYGIFSGKTAAPPTPPTAAPPTAAPTPPTTAPTSTPAPEALNWWDRLHRRLGTGKPEVPAPAPPMPAPTPEHFTGEGQDKQADAADKQAKAADTFKKSVEDDKANREQEKGFWDGLKSFLGGLTMRMGLTGPMGVGGEGAGAGGAGGGGTGAGGGAPGGGRAGGVTGPVAPGGGEAPSAPGAGPATHGTGRVPGGGGSGRGDKPFAGTLAAPGGEGVQRSLGVSAKQWDTFRRTMAGIESQGQYGIKGGSSNRFSGAYQFGAQEIRDTAQRLGETPPTREQFLADPAMQERYLGAYTQGHHETLMSTSPEYRALTAEQKLAALGYAHNQGAGGAARWLRSGQAGRDAFGTAGTRYSQAISRNLGEAGASLTGGGARPTGLDAPATHGTGTDISAHRGGAYTAAEVAQNRPATEQVAASLRAAGVETTSTYRSEGHRLSQKNPSSMHIRGRAIDLRARTPAEGAANLAKTREAMAAQGFVEGVHYNVLDETGSHRSAHATGSHLHLSLTQAGIAKQRGEAQPAVDPDRTRRDQPAAAPAPAPEPTPAPTPAPAPAIVRRPEGTPEPIVRPGERGYRGPDAGQNVRANAERLSSNENAPGQPGTAALSSGPIANDNSQRITQKNNFNTTITASDASTIGRDVRRNQEAQMGMALGHLRTTVRA